MSGRLENDIKINNRIKRLIEDEPKYIKDYYDFCCDKTASAKLIYISDVLSFKKYLKNNEGQRVENPYTFTKVKASTIKKYIYNNNELSSSRKAAMYYAIKNFFNFLKADRYIDENIFIDMKAPKLSSRKEVVVLEDQEIDMIKQNILNGVGSSRSRARQKAWIKRDYVLFFIALNLGLRVRTISELDISDIDFDKKEITVTEKGNKTRNIMFCEKTKELLIDWIEDRNEKFNKANIKKDTGALFITASFERLKESSIRHIFRKYSNSIENKKITPHTMRRTCGTNIYEETHDLFLVSEMLGHNNVNTSKIYAKLSDDRLKKVVEKIGSKFV